MITVVVTVVVVALLVFDRWFAIKDDAEKIINDAAIETWKRNWAAEYNAIWRHRIIKHSMRYVKKRTDK